MKREIPIFGDIIKGLCSFDKPNYEKKYKIFITNTSAYAAELLRAIKSGEC